MTSKIMIDQELVNNNVNYFMPHPLSRSTATYAAPTCAVLPWGLGVHLVETDTGLCSASLWSSQQSPDEIKFIF